MNFSKSQFLRTISNNLGRVAYNHEYTQIYIKISPFKSLIYKLFLLFCRNSDTENNSRLFKTYAVDLRRLLCRDLARILKPLVTFAEQIFFKIMNKQEYNELNLIISYVALLVSN